MIVHDDAIPTESVYKKVKDFFTKMRVEHPQSQNRNHVSRVGATHEGLGLVLSESQRSLNNF